MLESIPTERNQHKLFRLTTQRSILDFLEEQGLEGESVQEMQDLLHARGIVDSPDELCEAPFRVKTRLNKNGRHVTRFSDGSFPVFYSALEMETAEAEICHWFRKIVGNPNTPRTGYYLCFSCDFDGSVKDLRSKYKEWVELTYEDYKFCNILGAEAVQLLLDALLSPSARRVGGTCVPVFTKTSISNPQVVTHVAVTYDPSTDNAQLQVV